MQKCTLLLSVLLLTCVDSSSRRLSYGRTHFPAYLANGLVNEHNLHRRWRIHTETNDKLKELVKKNLIWLINTTNPNNSNSLENTLALDDIVTDVINKIIPERFDIFLNKYRVAEFVEEKDFVTSISSWFKRRPDPIVYSVWQYRPNVFSPGGTLTIEISYKLPISVKGCPEFYFTPIVVFSCDVVPGKYIRGSATFSNGTAELHTHKFLPWYHYNIGQFSLRPAHLSTTFKNSQF